MQILVVEDEEMLADAMAGLLTRYGHTINSVSRVDDAFEALAANRYNLIILDMRLPDGDGIDLLRRLRSEGREEAVIIVTGNDKVEQRIEGLNAGADDYLTKPVNLNELAARVSAVGRRYSGHANPAYIVDGLKINPAERKASINDQPIELSAREWALLTKLIMRQGTLVSKARLEEALFEFGAEVESNAIEVYVSRLRKKLGPSSIQTVRGLGYRVPESTT